MTLPNSHAVAAPASLRGFEAKYRDWGQRDVAGAYAGRLSRLDGDLLTVILVQAAGPFAGQLLSPNE